MKERGGRERAALWLWHAHNLVNLRLAKEPADEFIEFAKEEWPTKAECSSCHSVTLTHHAAKPIVGWDRKEVGLAKLSWLTCLPDVNEHWISSLRAGGTVFEHVLLPRAQVRMLERYAR